MLSLESAYCFHDIGMRTELKPAAFTAFSMACVAGALPQLVSPPMASSELPRFQPGAISCESCRLVIARIVPGVAGVPPPPCDATNTRVASAALELNVELPTLNLIQYQ